MLRSLLFSLSQADCRQHNHSYAAPPQSQLAWQVSISNGQLSSRVRKRTAANFIDSYLKYASCCGRIWIMLHRGSTVKRRLDCCGTFCRIFPCNY